LSIYPDKVQQHFLSPANVGEVARVDAAGTAGSVLCGAVVRVTLSIEPESRIIRDARFKAAGCGFLIACASVATELVQGLKLGEAAALPVEILEQALGPPPPGRSHCFELCLKAFEAAAIDYRSRMLEDWAGDEALICTCFGISESTIENAIRTGELYTVEEVGKACNAGRGCGSCRPLIEEILDNVRASEFQFPEEPL
jgi:NifU-like protein